MPHDPHPSISEVGRIVMSTHARIEATFLTSELHNSNHRGHWSIAAKKRAHMRLVSGMLAAVQTRYFGTVQSPVALTLWFQFPDRRIRDLDNLEVKGLIDGLVDAALLTGDGAKRLAPITRDLADGLAPKGTVRITAELRTVGN